MPGLAVVSLALALSMVSRPVEAQSNAPGAQAAKFENIYASPLARQIHQQLLMLPFYSVFDTITFSLDGKKVTLTGQVLRPTLRADAEAAIKSIEGVDVVIDQIEVLPTSTTDNELRRAIYRSIFEDPALAVYAVQAVPPIHIIVKNGNVTLEGAVKSVADKNLAAVRAGSVVNVAGIKNNLSVQARRNSTE